MNRILVRSESVDLVNRLVLALTRSSTTFEVCSVAPPSPVSDVAVLWRDQPTGRPEVVVLDLSLIHI